MGSNLTNSPSNAAVELRPDLLHRLDPLTHQLEAGRKRSAVIGHLLLVPTPANAENEPARGKLVDGRYLLGGVDGITLDDKTDPRRKLDGFRHRGGSGLARRTDRSYRNSTSAAQRRRATAICDWWECDCAPATTMTRNLAPPPPRQGRAVESSNPSETS
jgi:hypothetical protein